MATPAIDKPKTLPNIVIELGNPLQSIQNPFKEKEIPQTLSAIMEPEISKSVLISIVENGTSKVDVEPLIDILQQFRNTTQLLEKWIVVSTYSSNGTYHNCALDINSEKFSQLLQRGTSELQDQTLQPHYAPALVQTTLLAIAPHAADTELQRQAEILHNQHTTQLGRNQKLQQLERLQNQYATLPTAGPQTNDAQKQTCTTKQSYNGIKPRNFRATTNPTHNNIKARLLGERLPPTPGDKQ